MTYEDHESPDLPIGDVARKLSVSIETIRRWDKAGLIASSRTLGGQRRFAADEVLRVQSEMRNKKAAS